MQVTAIAGDPWHLKRLVEIDAEGGRLTAVALDAGAALGSSITVMASSPGLVSATLAIPVSVDRSDSVLDAAYSESPGPLSF